MYSLVRFNLQYPLLIKLDMTKRILIVDDDESMLNLLNRLLRKKYEVVLSTSAKEAIRNINKQKIDLLITDLKMPEIDGIELIREIREMNPKIGIVMLTASGDIDSYLEAMDLGTFEYLTKPFDKEMLLRVITSRIATDR